MKKNKNFIKNKKGGLSIETIVVSSIILTVGSVGIYYVNDKLNDSKNQLADNQEEQYENKDFVVNIEENHEPETLPPEDDSDNLLTDTEEEKATLEEHTLDLPLNEDQERISTITLEGLKEIESITVNNGGDVEILKIEGDKVTIKVTGGDVVDRVIVSGQYIAAVDKYVTKQPTANYSDADGYVGTLVRYLDSYSPAYTKDITLSRTSLTNSFPNSISYTEDGVTINLTKNGSVIIDTIKGSAAATKTVTNQESASYSEIINDNGVETKYTGTLTRYVHSGEASKSKTSTTTQQNTTNSFPSTMQYQDGDYSGTLSKSGSATSVVSKGSNTASKTVTAQPGPNYTETVIDNGKEAIYSGTLTAYVAKGSNVATKTGTDTRSSLDTNFDETIPYSETVVDNGITTTYEGTLTKSGTPVVSVYQGSDTKTKYVTEQISPDYVEDITDNGIETQYTGTLSIYVYQGSDTTTKTGTDSRVNITGEFDETIPYSETFVDNGITTTYEGTLSKKGTPTTVVRLGSDTKTKYVTAQTSPDYVEDITDNGIETQYTGTLSIYVYQGSDATTKTGTDSRSNTTGVFDETIPYSETINDNGISTKYTGTISKKGTPTTAVRAGSNTASKNVTNQTSSNYSETINDNGVTTQYTGTLSAYIYQGSDTKTKTGTDYRTSSSNSFNSTISYSETVNDNGISTKYTGTLSKSGSATVISGSASAQKSVTNQTSSSYSEYVSNDNGVSTYYTGSLSAYTETIGSKSVTDYLESTSNAFSATLSYSSGGYNGSLSKSGSSYVARGSSSGSKSVTGQTSSSYSEYVNDNGVGTYYTGSLSSYTETIGSTTATDYRTGTASTSFPSTVSYNSGGYSGTLSKSGSPTTTSGSASKTEYSGIGRNGTIVSSSSALYDTYNWGAHCSGGSYQWKTESEGAREYMDIDSLLNSYSLSSITYQMVYGRQYSISKNDNGQTANWTGNPSLSKYNTGSHPLRELTVCNNVSVPDTNYGSTGKSRRFRETVEVYWTGSLSKNDTRQLRQNYSGTVSQTATRYKGTVYKPDTRVYRQNYSGTATQTATRYKGTVTKPDTRTWRQNYSGTVTKPNTIVYRYSGTVTKPDTRLYTYTQQYSGTVSKPDTRVYRYQGNVTKPDTRLYTYTQQYSGTVSKPDTRVYRYQGDVTKPDTRIYGYVQTYKGTVTKPDTREYLYQGTVRKPDTREYIYTQKYTGTTYTPDTRVYRYQGTVRKPDTRVYEYTQNYKGLLSVPERAIYMYQGTVTKPAVDTRVFENLYEYTVNTKYYK